MNQWYPLAAVPEIRPGRAYWTRLLGTGVCYGVGPDTEPLAWRAGSKPSSSEPLGPMDSLDRLPVRAEHGYLWTTIGQPPNGIFAVPESAEPDRRTLNAATIGIAASAPRVVENFLDMAHFPYVHPHMLGEEPHTEVTEYNVEMRDGEIWAVDCRFYQPQAAAASSEGVVAEYLYRVPHPYCALLYKSAPTEDDRLDAIGIFIHPVSEEYVRAHLFLSLIDDVSTDTTIRRFQQTIFSQDKPILENQLPKRLPLDPRAETPIRADKMSVAYRRWLTELGVTYGVISA